MTDPYYPPGLKMPMSEAEIEHDRLWRRQREALTPQCPQPPERRRPHSIAASGELACQGANAMTDTINKTDIRSQEKIDQPSDLWVHRAAKMRCMTCMWWMRKSDSALGRCRRQSPIMSGWPATFETDWCGDHKLDEGKI